MLAWEAKPLVIFSALFLFYNQEIFRMIIWEKGQYWNNNRNKKGDQQKKKNGEMCSLKEMWNCTAGVSEHVLNSSMGINSGSLCTMERQRRHKGLLELVFGDPKLEQ